jgi:hypothetical protein
LVRFCLFTGAVVSQAVVEPGRNLNGHCCFSPNARFVYTGENDVMGRTGMIAVRDAASLVKTAEFPSHGIGPHDLIAEDTGTLLIANGGILKIPKAHNNDDPDVYRDRIDPSLVRIDARSGRLLGQWRLPDPGLSIRHLARGQNPVVGVALQAAHHMDAQRRDAPVLALFDGSHFEVARGASSKPLNGYGGDVAAVTDGNNTLFAVGCSHANAIAWWNDRGHWEGSYALRGACAVAAMQETTLAVTESGEAVQMSFDGQAIVERQGQLGLAWDNHVVVLPGHP